MSDLLLDIVNYLKDNNVVQGDGIDSFRDFSPETPDTVIVLHEYQGDPTPLQDSIVHRSIQITVRDVASSSAKAKCTEIFNHLSPKNRYLKLSKDRWCQIYPRQTPFKLRVDDRGRAIYGFNIGITTERD